MSTSDIEPAGPLGDTERRLPTNLAAVSGGETGESVAEISLFRVSVNDAAAVENVTVIGRVYGDVTVGSVDQTGASIRRVGAPVRGGAEHMRRRAFLRNFALGVGSSVSAGMWEALESIQQGIEEDLSSRSERRDLAQPWDVIAANYARSYAVRPPVSLLRDVVLDVSDLQSSIEESRSPARRKHLVRSLGQLSALVSILADDLGESRTSRNWMRTCRLAADEAGDQKLGAWSLAREAFFFLHYSGSPWRAVELARAAEEQAGSGRYAAGVMAPTVEARALAELGDEHGALIALGRAEDAFDMVGDPESGGVFGWTEQQLRFSAGKSLTTLGSTRLALDAQDRALDLFPATEILDPTLVRLDRAQALIRGGDVVGGCQFGIETLQGIPAEFRSQLIKSWADDALLAVPKDARRLAAVREFGEVGKMLLS
ncbi:hypothetical protein MXD61_10970 [Frankia sp. AgPm24]|uniref:hypothetical protein n=1 Tax=Frankia sp. AgPm24 TaxID=631128 RepID=UPI00200F5D4B|nr:hypothetical protein [Frankia sp. AgPm24]MCK9922392.1 hypothetical protein [Frankia sp. AgPm24]